MRAAGGCVEKPGMRDARKIEIKKGRKKMFRARNVHQTLG
jgi:hypothetical protein